MRKFVISVIYSLILTLVSVAVIFLLQAPLLSLVYYGFFTNSNSSAFGAKVINKLVDTDSLTILIMVAQVLLTMGFVLCLFYFIQKIFRLFLKNEKLVRGYYITFFFMTLVLPVILIFLSVFLKVKLRILIITIEALFTILNIVLIFFTNKILPETTDLDYRKYLFTEGNKDE